MSSILSRSPRLLSHFHSHHVNCIRFGFGSKEFALRGFRDLSSRGTSSLKKKKDSRFFLPGNLGISWEVNANYQDMRLPEVVDYLNNSPKRLHIKVDTCPYLVTQTTDIKDMFPVFIYPDGPSSIVMLSYDHFEDVDLGIKYFFIAANMIIVQLQHAGHTSNFINPYTGRPFDDYSSLLKLDPAYFKGACERAATSHRLSNDKLKSSEECLYIRPHKSNKIGMVYSTAPSSVVERLIL